MKKIVKIFNNFIKRTIFKVENKTNDKFHASNFSKYVITVICILFAYIFYLLIPLLYDKNWVQNKIVSKLSTEFNISLGNSFDISYRILPKPHYLIRDSKTALAEIKVLKISPFKSKRLNKFFLSKNKNALEILIIEITSFKLSLKKILLLLILIFFLENLFSLFL